MFYCKPISIPHEPIIDTRVITDIQQRQTTLNLSLLNSNFNNYLKNLNLSVVFAELFYIKPGVVTDIHVDSDQGDIVKINYIYGGLNSHMNWYEPINMSAGNHSLTRIGTKYVYYTKSQVRLVHSQAITTSSIVQVGCPHNITNQSQDRHCLSLVIAENNKRLTMHRAMEIFGIAGEI